MSIFPSEFYTGEVPIVVAPSYSLTDYLIDFETGTIVLNETGQAIIVEGLDALNCQIWRKLNTMKERYLIYSQEYGNTLYELQGYSKANADSLISIKLNEAIVDNYYVLGVRNIETEFDGSLYTVHFQIDTIFGVTRDTVINSLTIRLD